MFFFCDLQIYDHLPITSDSQGCIACMSSYIYVRNVCLEKAVKKYVYSRVEQKVVKSLNIDITSPILPFHIIIYASQTREGDSLGLSVLAVVRSKCDD